MKLSVKGLAIAMGLIWGVLAMFVIGVANLVWPPYARAFLDIMASVYPGYTGAPTFGQVIVGSLYGLVDGAIAGALLAWLYNRFAAA
jgi:hypothetical protein